MQYRDVLPVTYAFGTGACYSGYEGISSDDDRFLTCHYNIFEPSWLQRNSIPLIVGYVTRTKSFTLLSLRCYIPVVLKVQRHL